MKTLPAMHFLDGLPILDHSTSLSEKGREEDAWKILQEFFSFFDDGSAGEHLWYLLAMALRSESDQLTAHNRGNLLFFYEYCTALFKAASFLDRQRHKKARKKPGRLPAKSRAG